MTTSMWWRSLRITVPVCFALGAGMELFMIKTGFYDIVTRKEGERQAIARRERDQYWEERRRREAAAASSSNSTTSS